MKRFLLAGLLLITGLFAVFINTSCSNRVEITIELSEFAYTPDTIELVVGQEVTLNFINTGTLRHEFMVGREASFHDGFADGYNQDFFTAAGMQPNLISGIGMLDGNILEPEEGMDVAILMEADSLCTEDHGEHLGYMVMLTPAVNTATITFTVIPEMIGEWQIGCFTDAGTHYAAGMVGKLIVTDQ